MNKSSRDNRLWRLFHWASFRYLARAARKVMQSRSFATAAGQDRRWLPGDTDKFLDLAKQEAEILRPVAKLDDLPSVGNRIMVELAVLTIAAYRVLCDLGIERTEARAAVADIGWEIYSSQLRLASLPARLSTGDPGKRLQRTIRQLLRFPFNAPGAPGYAVKSWSEDGNIYTHFTHCPPQTFVRNLIAELGDKGELEAFTASWCAYDWPGADIIADDGQRGHYTRRQTLSKGDKMCDMCWKGQAGDI